MSFEQPYAFLFLPAVLAAGWFMLRRARRKGVRFSAASRVGAAPLSWRLVLAAAAPYFFIAGLLLLTVAAARPRESMAKGRKNVDAIAIVMTMDISGSMCALDLTPPRERPSRDTTRLAVVKKVFSEFVEMRPDGLIGLVAFGGYASTRVPLTADHESLLLALRGIEIPTDDDEQKTAMGDGLAVALARLKDAPLKSKVVILLSDGANNVGRESGAVEPETAAEMAAKMGVKVYAIGIGSNANFVNYLVKDDYGRDVIARARSGFDEGQLREIASKTGGRYYSVNDKNALENAIGEIDQLETTSIDAEVWNRWKEYFMPFLVIGALSLVLAVVFSMAGARRLA